MSDRMKLKSAIKILIDNAAANIAGTGCGIRSLPSETEQRRTKDALRRAWRYVYGWEMASSDFHNRGLRDPNTPGIKGVQ